jgi:lipopolysaccharide exporter
MKIKLNEIRDSVFFKDSLYMVFSTVLMQIISIGTIPILSRLFSPKSFGIHGTYRSTIIIVSIILTLCMEMAIVLPKGDFEKKRIYLTTFFTLLSTTIILLLIYYLFIFFDVNLLSNIYQNKNNSFIFLILIGSALIGLTNMNQSRLVSLKMFKEIALSRFILPSMFFLFAVLFYYSGYNFEGLVYAQILAYIVLFLFLHKFIKLNFKIFNFRIFKEVFKKYKEIPIFTFPNTLLNTISLNLPLIILGVLYNDTVVGYYAIGVKLVSLPVSFISSSFTQVFYKKTIDLYNDNRNKFHVFVKKTMFGLLAIGIIIFSIIYFLIPQLVPLFLGSQWVESVDYLQFICFWQALMLVNSPVASIAILLKKQKQLLIFQILYLITRSFALWYPYYLGLTAKDSVLFYAITGVVFNIYLFGFLLKISRKSKNKQR